MSKRPPNELETKLHRAILSTAKHEMTTRQTEAIIPDAIVRQNALNFLLAVGLLKPLADAKGALTAFRAVTKGELTVSKDLTGEENLVLGHIKAAGNEGMWTKHLKAKTNLHQTVIDRCLKTLAQKSLIKRVQSVQHPTRKIYMLFNLDPSIALTGGPWYTDNELDTEFIKHLTDACLKFIRDLTLPKSHAQGKDNLLYAISNPPKYPTAQHIRNSLRQARLTETDLSVEHVEMLLNVLVLDGEIEKIPSFGVHLWDPNAIDEGETSEENEKRSKKKRKHVVEESSEEEIAKKRKKKKKKKPVSSEEESSDSDEDDRRKKSKRKKKVEESSGDSSEDESPKRKTKKKKRKRKDSVSDDPSDSEVESRSSRKKKKKKKAVKQESSEEEEDESSDSDSDSNTRSRKSRKSKSKSKRRSPSPTLSDQLAQDGMGFVYRAIRQEIVFSGWAEAPCSKCPTFDFCKPGGPVNPKECVYYGEWLNTGTVASHDTDV